MSTIIHDKAIIEDNVRIGNGTRIWAFVNVCSGAVIGENCNVCDGSYVEKGAVIGNNVTIKHNVAIFDGIKIEDDVFIGSNVAFINDRNPRSVRSDPWTLEKTVVQNGATIGSNATLLCGVNVGEYAMVGAGSVVTGDVPAYSIVFGNPAEEKGYACQCGHKLDDKLSCRCGKTYTLNNNQLSPNE